MELASLGGRITDVSEAAIPVTDGGIIHGDGVFEIVRVYAGRPFALREHLDRLVVSSRRMRLAYDVDTDSLITDTDTLVAQRGGEDFDGCIRIVITSSGRRIILTEPLPMWPERARLACITYSPTHILDGIKSISYAANMQASRLARERHADEALLVTPHGWILEAPTSSFFYVLDDGILSTPPLDDHVLPSITRDVLVSTMGLRERSVTKDEVLTAVEAFLASTTREVQSVAAIDGTELGEAGPRTADASAALQSVIDRRLSA